MAIYDEADLTVIRRQIILSVKDFISPNSDDCSSIDDLMDDVKARLQQPGMRLEISGHGFGDGLVLNDLAAESEWDINGGPKPRKVEIDPIGFNLVSQITWQCEINRGPCGDGGNDTGVASFNFGITHSVNSRGYTTRVISGYLTIASKQSGGEHDPFEAASLADNADNYRDFVTDHFRKLDNSAQDQTFSTSKDHSRLEFHIIDREHESPNAFPEGVIWISAPIRTRFPRPSVNVLATSTISIDLELEAGQPRVRAYEIFNGIFVSRIENAKNPIALDLTITEDPYSHRYSFSLTFTSTGTVAEQLGNLKYFSPLPESWTDWHDSMEKVKSNRGLTGIRNSTSIGDRVKLVNLCDNSDQEYETEGEGIEPEDKALFAFCSEPPPPELSWFDPNVVLIEAPMIQAVVQTTYGEAGVEQSDYDPSDGGDFHEGTMIKTTGDYETCVSQGAPIQRWIWKGSIQRIGYPIPPITKPMIGDQEATIVGEPQFYSRLIGYAACLPVYEAVWNIGLVVTNTPEPTDDDKEAG